jgi:hypothetical protein
MQTINDWNDRAINVVRSRGGVIATVNPYDNLIRSGVSPWPPPEIVQKLYKSEQQNKFDDPSVAGFAGHYSDLQSINSEDAITWSFFGPLVYGVPRVRREFLTELCELIGIAEPRGDAIHAWLWRRLPHPETFVSGGPEVDFGLQSDDMVVLGEAKWNSKVDRKQGVLKTKTQIELRDMFCGGMGHKIYPDCQRFLILGVSQTGDVVKPYLAGCSGGKVAMHDIAWTDLCRFASLPHAAEFRRYYDWKCQMGQRQTNP